MVAGQDVSLVGCDCSVWHRPLLPRITSVEACWREAGQTAVRLLLEMRNETTSRCGKVLLNPVVVEGDTCPGSVASPQT
jgi:DNA-binding LacI/PurR family transcriptional regulator